MFCCIGGHIPKEPVINRRNGALYEKALIEKYLAQNGPRCPVTGEPLTRDDLIAVHGGAANAAPGIARMAAVDSSSSSAAASGASSVPGLLSMLQVEWEALTLEQFSLRQQLASAQQELSLALYKHDAACRVIANLVKERDAAILQLRSGGGGSNSTGAVAASALQHGGAATAAAANSSSLQQTDRDAAQRLIEQAGGVPSRIADEFEVNSERLKATRRNRDVPPGTASVENIRTAVEQKDVQPPHSGGVSSLAVVDQNGSRRIFTGGVDGKAVCYDLDRNVTHSTMMGHTKQITRVWAAADTCITASADGTARIWRSDVGSFVSRATLRHANGINDFVVMPMGGSSPLQYGLTAGVDGCLRLHNLETGIAVADGGANRGSGSSGGLSAVAMHPYGLLAGTCAGPTLHLWDVRTMEVDTSISLDHNSGNATSLHFHADGKTVAVGTNFGVVQLWDLRHREKPTTVLQWGEATATQMLRKPVSRVCFDESGQFLAVAADQVRIWGVSAGQPLALLATHTEAPTDVAWGRGANWIASCSASSKHVKVFAPQ